MPYVKQARREDLTEVILAMLDAEVKVDGDLNYILYQVIEGYGHYKNFMAELNECAEQIRQDFLVPYEKRKKEENGDV